MEKNFLEKIKGKKILFLMILLIPFISILLIIMFRHTYAPTNEEIIESIKSIKSYTVEAEYTIKNSKGEYKQETKMYYCKDVGMRIEFDGDRVKIYKDGYINMKDKNDEYELNESIDIVYPLSFYNNLLNNPIESIEENEQEWGDTKYLEILVNLPGNNKHLSKAKVYVDKENKKPLVSKIYDNNGKECITIVYKNFEEVKEIDKKLF